MLIELCNVTKTYPGNPIPVLDEVSLIFPEEQAIAVVGPSGSGKSTLLHMLGTLDFPSQGKVLLQGKDTRSLTREELVHFRNRNIGFVFQTHMLLPQLRVMENIMLPLITRKKQEQQEGREEAMTLLEELGLQAMSQRYPSELSVGECQRVAVIRALIHHPGLLLADEPTGSLDHDHALRLVDLLLELREIRKFSLIMITHSNTVASRMNVIYRLQSGKITRE